MQYSVGSLSWIGRIAEVIPGGIHAHEIVFLKLDEPVPFMYGPDEIVASVIEKRHILNESWGIGAQTYVAMIEAKMRTPYGSWQGKPKELADAGYRAQSTLFTLPPNSYFFAFDHPYPLDKIYEMCHKWYRGSPGCWLQASVLRTIPIMEVHGMRESEREYPPVWETLLL
jgi:hypothetical protein